MKTLRAVCVVVVATSLVLGAAADSASAEHFFGWGSAGCGSGGCGYGGCGAGGYGGVCGYGGCGLGGCGMGGGCVTSFWIFGDYEPYIIGHGPMFPAGDFQPAYSYLAPLTPDTVTATPTTNAPAPAPGPGFTPTPAPAVMPAPGLTPAPAPVFTPAPTPPVPRNP